MIVACIFVAVLQDVISLYDCEMIMIFYLVHWLILYLLCSTCCFSSFEILLCVWLLLFHNNWSLCMIVKWYLSYSQYIEWFISCLNLHFILYFSIIVKGMLLVVFPEVIFLYYFVIIIIFIKFIDWLYTCID